MSNNGYAPLNNGLVITTDQSGPVTYTMEPPSYIQTLDSPNLYPQYVATGGPSHVSIPVGHEYTAGGIGINLKDPQFIDQFSGHIEGPPPISAWFSEALNLVLRNIWSFIGWGFLYALAYVFQIVLHTAIHTGWILLTFLSFASFAVTTFCMVVGVSLAFKTLRQDINSPADDFQTQLTDLLTTIKEVITNYKLLLSALLLSLVMGLAVSLGFICLIFPGVWLLVSFMLSVHILVEHNDDLLSIIDAMRISKNIVNKNWCYYFLLAIIMGLLHLLLIPYPVVILVQAIAVRDTLGLRTAEL